MPSTSKKRLRTQSCQSTARVHHGHASSQLGRDRGCPTQAFTHTFSSSSNKRSLFHIPYSGAGSKSTSSLFHSLTLPGEEPSPTPQLPSLHWTPLSPRLGPPALGKALLRSQQLTWQRRPPNLAAASIQDKQLVLSVHGKPTTFLMAPHGRMS